MECTQLGTPNWSPGWQVHRISDRWSYEVAAHPRTGTRCAHADNRQSAVAGTQFQFSRVGRLGFPTNLWADGCSAVFYRTTAWPLALTPRFDAERNPLNLATAGPIEAIDFGSHFGPLFVKAVYASGQSLTVISETLKVIVSKKAHFSEKSPQFIFMGNMIRAL